MPGGAILSSTAYPVSVCPFILSLFVLYFTSHTTLLPLPHNLLVLSLPCWIAASVGSVRQNMVITSFPKGKYRHPTKSTEDENTTQSQLPAMVEELLGR